MRPKFWFNGSDSHDLGDKLSVIAPFASFRLIVELEQCRLCAVFQFVKVSHGLSEIGFF